MNLNNFKIKLRMAENGLNKTSLAERMEISRQWVGIVLDRGYATSDFINKLARALDLEIKDIVKEEV